MKIKLPLYVLTKLFKLHVVINNNRKHRLLFHLLVPSSLVILLHPKEDRRKTCPLFEKKKNEKLDVELTLRDK